MGTPRSVVQVERYLVLDIGHAFTRGHLWDVAEGTYQLLATAMVPSTWETPVQDVRESVLQVVEALETVTQLTLQEEGEIIHPKDPAARGVDHILLLTSAEPPMRVAVLGILESFSLRSALRALQPFPVDIVAAFHMNDRLTLAQRMEHMLHALPDVIVLTGGTDGGAQNALREYVNLLEWMAPLFPPEERPVLVYAGNKDLRPSIQNRLAQLYDLRMADNVRPALEEENPEGLQHLFKDLQQEHLLRHVPGIESLLRMARRWEGFERAWARMVQALALVHEAQGFVGVHIGSGRSAVVVGDGEEFRLRVFFYGLGHGLERFYPHLDEEALKGWAVDLDTPLAELHLKMLYPETLPETPSEAWLEFGLAYQIARHILAESLPPRDAHLFQGYGLHRRYDLLVIGGGPWQMALYNDAALLTALDIFQPLGLVHLWADAHHLLAPLGLLLEENPYVPAQMMRSPHLLPLATVVPVWGRRSPSRTPARVQITWGQHQRLSLHLRGGTVRRLPLPPMYQARLEAIPLGPHDVGAGFGRPLQRNIQGGWKGVVIDARGRPVRFPQGVEAHHAQRKAWLQGLQA